MIRADQIAPFPTVNGRPDHVVFIDQPQAEMTDAERDKYVADNTYSPVGWRIAGTVACRAEAGDTRNRSGWRIRIRFERVRVRPVPAF